MKLNTKGGAPVIILVLIILIILVVWLVNIGNRECSANEDCKSQQYCGADFECHDFPVIEKNVYDVHFVWPAVIVAAGIIAGAFILRRRKNKKEDGNIPEYYEAQR